MLPTSFRYDAFPILAKHDQNVLCYGQHDLPINIVVVDTFVNTPLTLWSCVFPQKFDITHSKLEVGGIRVAASHIVCV
jgi:hypothetical protein